MGFNESGARLNAQYGIARENRTFREFYGFNWSFFTDYHKHLHNSGDTCKETAGISQNQLGVLGIRDDASPSPSAHLCNCY